MSEITPIQWCDSTVNPIMGCAGCELFPKPATIFQKIDDDILKVCASWKKGRAREIYMELIDAAYREIANPSDHHHSNPTTTNLYHFRDRFITRVKDDIGPEAAEIARHVIAQQITCYAAKLCMNKSYSVLHPSRVPSSGYPATFEELKTYPERMLEAAKMSDLLGRENSSTPWKKRLARMIFVSDMGDAFSSQDHFDFLETHVMPAISSEQGRKHLWLWLTKRPNLMAKFSERIGGFPENVCAMTTLTCSDPSNQARLAELKKVKASVRGLSIEPLWDDIASKGLDLDGIHWAIVGGESGSADDTRGFHLEWADKLREHCHEHGVAYFLKQLGRKPFCGGKPMDLNDPHGGDWSEWTEAYRVREFPSYFHQFREDERVDWDEARPAYPVKVKKSNRETLSSEDKSLLTKLEKTVREGALKFIEVGNALAEIKEKRLYREKYKTFSKYCDDVLELSRQHANRLIKASETKKHVDPVLKRYGLPKATSERHLREYGRLKDDGDLVAVIKELADACDKDENEQRSVPLNVLEKKVTSRIEKKARGTGKVENILSEPTSVEPEVLMDGQTTQAGLVSEISLENVLNQALTLVRDGDEKSALELLGSVVQRYHDEIELAS